MRTGGAKILFLAFGFAAVIGVGLEPSVEAGASTVTGRGSGKPAEPTDWSPQGGIGDGRGDDDPIRSKAAENVMIEKLRRIFRTDEFAISSAVFPDIDSERLAAELDLAAEGEERGRSGQPKSTSGNLDHVELRAVARVDDLRRRGLENFEINRRAYSERLNNTGYAKTLVKDEAGKAKARFTEDVTKWRDRMVAPRERVEEAYRWRAKFREQNRLDGRPAKPALSWGWIIGLGLLLIVLESIGNAYLFSQSNPLGLLGGLLAAILVSFANVSVCTFFGSGLRFANFRGVRNIHKKLFGMILGILWFAFACTYNSGVAHFRDAVETTLDWLEAGILAVETLIANPAELNTLESYVLFILGFVISVASLLKGYHSSDPYPGYSKVSKDVDEARDNFVQHMEEFIETLAEHRDNASDDLRDARDEIERQVRDSVDALYGQRTLNSNLTPFLEQCDVAVNYLLSVYRDANKAAREGESPEYFNGEYHFKEFTFPVEDDDQREAAEKQAKEVAELVENAVNEISVIFENAVRDHYGIDEVEGSDFDWSSRRRPTAPDALSPNVSLSKDGRKGSV